MAGVFVDDGGRCRRAKRFERDKNILGILTDWVLLPLSFSIYNCVLVPFK